MPHRNDLEAAHARIEALEREAKRSQDQIDALRAEADDSDYRDDTVADADGSESDPFSMPIVHLRKNVLAVEGETGLAIRKVSGSSFTTRLKVKSEVTAADVKLVLARKLLYLVEANENSWSVNEGRFSLSLSIEVGSQGLSIHSGFRDNKTATGPFVVLGSLIASGMLAMYSVGASLALMIPTILGVMIATSLTSSDGQRRARSLLERAAATIEEDSRLSVG